MSNLDTEKEFYIITGRSGCGKGTQAELLKIFLENKSENKKVLHVTTGGNFREFIKKDNYTTNETRETLNTGGLMPEFLAIWNWSSIFIDTLTGDDSVILDGAPRKLIEVEALESAINFYKYKKVTIIYVNVNPGWAIDKLISRGREDDNDKLEQERKMFWFQSEVLPCIDRYRKISKSNIEKNGIEYKFLEINGEQSIDMVHLEIVSQIKINNK